MKGLPLRIRLRDGSLDVVHDFRSCGVSSVNQHETVYEVTSKVDWKTYRITFDDIDVLSIDEYRELSGPETTPEPVR